MPVQGMLNHPLEEYNTLLSRMGGRPMNPVLDPKAGIQPSPNYGDVLSNPQNYVNPWQSMEQQLVGEPSEENPTADWILRQTGSPLLATIAHLGLDPANFGGGPVALGTMAGVKGATNLMQRHAEYGPMQAIRMAQKMEERGVPRERIWDATAEFFRREDLPYAGVYKGVDDQWRFEIPDTEAKVLKEPGLRYPEPQSDVFQHEALAKAYPETRDVNVVGDIDSYSSEYTVPDKFRMSLLKGEDDLRKGFLHENQHVVQDVENFARGGAPDEFIPSAFELKNAKAEAIATEYLLNEAKGGGGELSSFMQKKGFSPQSEKNFTHVSDVIWFMNYVELQGLKGAERVAALEKLLKEKKSELSGMRTIRSNTSLANEKYKRLAGEVESRSTERRGDLPLEQLRKTFPWLSMDRDVDKQIIKRKGILE